MENRVSQVNNEYEYSEWFVYLDEKIILLQNVYNVTMPILVLVTLYR
jgi:hypothetical protein